MPKMKTQIASVGMFFLSAAVLVAQNQFPLGPTSATNLIFVWQDRSPTFGVRRALEVSLEGQATIFVSNLVFKTTKIPAATFTSLTNQLTGLLLRANGYTNSSLGMNMFDVGCDQVRAAVNGLSLELESVHPHLTDTPGEMWMEGGEKVRKKGESKAKALEQSSREYQQFRKLWNDLEVIMNKHGVPAPGRKWEAPLDEENP